MKEYRITYISREDGDTKEGCEYATSGQEAVRQFMDYTFDCDRIVRVQRAA